MQLAQSLVLTISLMMTLIFLGGSIFSFLNGKNTLGFLLFFAMGIFIVCDVIVGIKWEKYFSLFDKIN